MTKKRFKQAIEHRKKIGLANAIKLKGKICSKDGLQKIIKIHREKREKYGYVNSPETRKKISNTWKKKWANGEVTEKQRQNLVICRKNSKKTQFKKGHSVPKSWREAVKKSRAKQVFPMNDSSIEIKIQDFLKELDIEFFTHQYIKEIKHSYQCDILIPSMKLVIECDGNYWHKYPIGKDVDHIRTKELIEKGFKVLRLWESDIKKMELNDFKNILEVNSIAFM